MRFKKGLFVAMLFFFVSFLFCFNVCADPVIVVDSYSVSPSVLMPGDSGVLTVDITNAESTSSKTVSTVDGGTTTTLSEIVGAEIDSIWVDDVIVSSSKLRIPSTYNDIGVISPGDTISFSFKISADKSLDPGFYYPVAHVDLEYEFYEDAAYPVKVVVSNSTVDLIETDVPSRVSNSGSTDVTLTVFNNFEADVDGVVVTSSLVSGVEVTPKSVYVGSLTAGSSSDVVFTLKPSETGFKNLRFNASFKNGFNYHYTVLESQVEFFDNPDVAPVLYYNSKYISKGSSSKIRLEVYNAKTEAISGVIVIPNVNDDSVVISPSKYFIGSMDPDDVFSASFDVYTDNLVIGRNYSIDFGVSFKQGENYYETESVITGFQVVKPQKVEDGGFINTTILLVVVVIAVLLIVNGVRKRRIS